MNAKTVLLLVALFCFFMGAVLPYVTDRVSPVQLISLGLFFFTLSILIA